MSAAYDETAHNKRRGIRLLRLRHVTITFQGRAGKKFQCVLLEAAWKCGERLTKNADAGD
jgi:hypothetical protein